MNGWHDISLPLRRDTPHSPESPPFLSRRVLNLSHGDSRNISVIWIGSHCGTHLNAPLHVLEAGAGTDGMPLETACGPARVISIPDASIGEAELRRHIILPEERLLIATRGGRARRSSSGHLTRDGARFLATLRLKLIGIDSLDIGTAGDDEPFVIRTLLASGAWVLEGLDLESSDPGRYELVCLPLPLEALDGAPARVIVRPL
jgi:arylformamidase